MTSIAALALSSSALAAQPGYFAGVNLGYGDTRAQTDASLTTETTGIAYGLNGGYNFTNYFGVEVDVNRDANAKYKLNGETVVTHRVYDVDLLANGYLNVTDSFDLVGKAGFAYVRAGRFDTNTNRTHYYRPKAVLGIMYTATEDVSISATYSRILKQGSYSETSTARYLPNVDVAAISVDYLF